MPATWHTPKTWALNELVTETLLNQQLRDNLEYLLTRPDKAYIANETANYVTSSTAFVDVSAARLSLTLTPASSRVLVGFQGSFSGTGSANGSYYVYLDIAVNGIRTAGDDGILCHIGGNGTYIPLAFVRLIEGLTPGTSYTFKLQWKANHSYPGATPTVTLFAGAGTASLDIHPQLWVKEG